MAYFGEDLGTTFSGHKISAHASGNSIVEKVPVFKAGTFRNSYGEQRTWTADELGQMVANFNKLRTEDKLPNVPIRADHSNSIDKVIGYIESLSTDGEFLYADEMITEPDALAKMKRGTYRSRSSEIGPYEDNNDALYWPVFRGVAYVPTPAVEGLHSKEELPMAFFSRCDDPKENKVGTDNQADDKGAKTPVQTAEFKAPDAFKFSLDGQETSDYAAVQRHIATLEGTVKASIEKGRGDYVAKLASDRKITGPQAEKFTAFVQTLNDAQFASWKEGYDVAPVLPILAQHGSIDPDRKGGPGSGEVDPLDDAIAIQEGILKNFERTGTMTPEKLAALPAHIKLQALYAQKNKGA